MRERFGDARVGPYRMAIAFARLGDADAAFAWLERAAQARDLNLVCMAVDPSFDALRGDARWRPALLRYGLPDVAMRGASRALTRTGAELGTDLASIVVWVASRKDARRNAFPTVDRHAGPDPASAPIDRRASCNGDYRDQDDPLPLRSRARSDAPRHTVRRRVHPPRADLRDPPNVRMPRAKAA